MRDGELNLTDEIKDKVSKRLIGNREYIQDCQKQNEQPKWEEQFTTDPRRRLGRQVDELFNFVNTSHQLAIPQGLHNVVDATTFYQIYNLLYANYDISWFRPLVVLSLYSYLETYTGNIIEWIEEHVPSCDRLSNHIIEYLDSLDENAKPSIAKHKNYPELPFQKLVKGLSVKNRPIHIERGLSLDTLLTNYLKEEELNYYRENWKKYVRIRHSAAHRDPSVALPEDLVQAADEILGNPEDYFSGSMMYRSLSACVGGRVIQNKMKQTVYGYRRIAQLFTMALYYHVYIDAGLSASSDN